MSRGLTIFLLLIIASVFLISKSGNKNISNAHNENGVTEFQPTATPNLQAEHHVTTPKRLKSKHLSSTTVYICKGPNSKRYHYKKSCRGLKSCSTKLHEVSLTEARDIGRTLCGWEK